ncbi:hypothetical protein BRC81_12930 [Halobacteriales archaeon QS_1_68_20]|nr:MAG: hypothetical protein BRC81_12930 [Halobacteriales archaeon QS_1_68_20]
MDAQDLFVGVAGTDPLVQALGGGLIIAGMNTLGAVLVFVWRNPKERRLDGALGFAAGAILPYSMGFAAGGMLFVISDEIVPETHARGHERIATVGTMAGVVVMLFLDVALAG